MQKIVHGYYDGAQMGRYSENPYEVCVKQFKARYMFNKVNCAQLTNFVMPFFDINR